MALKGSLSSFVALEMDMKQFKERDFDVLSSLMVRGDIGQLVVGARGKVFTLSLDDITKKTSEVTRESCDFQS